MTDFEVANYFELETMFLHDKDPNLFQDWKQFYQTSGRRPEYDVLIQYTNGTDERIEVKAQNKSIKWIHFEYEQVYKGDNTNNIYPAGLLLSDSDFYYVYKYDNKPQLYNYVRNRWFSPPKIDPTPSFTYDLYKIPTDDIKKWYEDTINKRNNPYEYKFDTPQARSATITNNTYSKNYGFTLSVNTSFLSNYKYFSSNLPPLQDLNKYYCKEFQFTENIFKFTGYAGHPSERPVLDANGDTERDTRVIDVLQFKKVCKNRINIKSPELLGKGKYKDSDTSGSSSESEEERKDLRTFYKKLTNKIKSTKK
jgi:hypothetical protein